MSARGARAATAAKAFLQDDETVETAASGTIDRVSRSKEMAKDVALGALAAVATAGTFTVYRRSIVLSIVLTNRRLLVLRVEGIKTLRVRKVFELDRARLKARRTSVFPALPLLARSYLLLQEAGEPIARMTLALGEMAAGDEIARSLGA